MPRDLLIAAFAPAVWGTTYVVTTEFLPPGRPLLTATLRALPRPAGTCSPGAAHRLVVVAVRGPRRAQLRGVLRLVFAAAYRLPGGSPPPSAPSNRCGRRAVLLSAAPRRVTPRRRHRCRWGGLLVLGREAALDPVGVVPPSAGPVDGLRDRGLQAVGPPARPLTPPAGSSPPAAGTPARRPGPRGPPTCPDRRNSSPTWPARRYRWPTRLVPWHHRLPAAPPSSPCSAPWSPPCWAGSPSTSSSPPSSWPVSPWSPPPSPSPNCARPRHPPTCSPPCQPPPARPDPTHRALTVTPHLRRTYVESIRCKSRTDRGFGPAPRSTPWTRHPSTPNAPPA